MKTLQQLAFETSGSRTRRYADGGMIRGPGTGTSDSIRDDKRVGTYIMPADATRSLGARTLRSLGKYKAPVRVSDGEFEFTPEQVHAVGVQALSSLKDVARGTVQGFAMGGVVEDQSLSALRRAREAQPVGSPNIAAIDQSIDQRNQSIGGAASALSTMASAFQKPVQTAASNPTDMRLSANTQSTPMGMQAQEVQSNVQIGSPTPAVQAPSLAQQAAQPTPTQPAAQALSQMPSLAPVQAQGFQAPTVRHSGNDWQARNDLRNARVSASSITNKPEWSGAGMGRFRGGQQQGPSDSTMAYQAALAQDAAARGEEVKGQQQALGFTAAGQREAMQQTGESQRTAINAQRFDEATRISRDRLTLEQIGAGFQNRTNERVERAQAELENAKTPEAQRTARARLMALTGKTDNDAWAHSPGGQVVDPKTQQLITQPGVIYNRLTGEARVQSGGQGLGAQLPSKESLVQGQVYQTKSGAMRWNGSGFDRAG